MKLSFQHFILMAGVVGVAASPALGQIEPAFFSYFDDEDLPNTPAAQVILTEYSQEWIYQYIQNRMGLQSRLRQRLHTVSEMPREPLDVSGLQINGLPLSERSNVVWPSTTAINHAVQAEITAYQTAYSATDLLKANEVSSSSQEVSQESDQPTALTDTSSPWAAFLSGDIAWGTTQSVDTFDLNNYIILAGADYTLNPNLMLGGTISYSTGSQRNTLANADADSIALSLYGASEYGAGGYTTGFVGYGFDSFNSRRTVLGAAADAVGSSSGNQFNIGVETGWSFLAGRVFLQPSLGLRYTSNSVNGYTETLTGVPFTTFDSYNTNSTIAKLGFDVAYPIATGDRYIMPFAGVGLNQRLGYSAPVVTANFGGGGVLTLPAPDIDYTWMNLTLGVSADLSPRTVGQIIFRTDLARSDASINNFSINLRHDF